MVASYDLSLVINYLNSIIKQWNKIVKELLELSAGNVVLFLEINVLLVPLMLEPLRLLSYKDIISILIITFNSKITKIDKSNELNI